MTNPVRLYSNHARTLLKTSLGATGTTIEVVDGSLFPSPADNQFFVLTLDNGSTREIVEVWGKNGNVFTGVVRAREGSTAHFFPAGTSIELRPTAGSLSKIEALSNIVEGLQESNFSNVNSITLSSTPDAPENRRLTWSTSEKTLDIGVGTAGTAVMHVGQHSMLLGVNLNNYTIQKGSPVAVSGVDTVTKRVSIVKATAESGATAVNYISIASETIPPGQVGLCQTRGILDSIDATGYSYGETWSIGDVVYVSPTTPGYLTKTAPSYPNYSWSIGVVTNNTVTGSLFVDVSQSLTSAADGSISPSKLSTGKPVWDTSGNLGVGIPSTPAVKLEVNGNLRLLSGNSGGPTFNYNWLNTSGSTASYKIALLPAASANIYDSILISGVVDSGGTSNTRSPLEVIAGNRGGLTVRYLSGPSTGYPSHIDFRTEADGSTSIWVVQDSAVSSISLSILSAFGSVTTYPSPLAASPTGTLAFSTYSSLPYHRYDITTGALTVGGNISGNASTVTNGVYLTGPQTLSGKTLVTPVLSNGYTEQVYSIVGTTPQITPLNGSIQTWTLSSVSTPQLGSWSEGQSLILMVDDGTAYSIDWSNLGVSWRTPTSTAPTLKTSGYTIIGFWKVGSVLYGIVIGS